MQAPTSAKRGGVLLIGYSFVGAIEAAWRDAAERGEGAFEMRTLRLTGRLAYVDPTRNGEIVRDPEILRALQETVRECAPRLVVGAFWGNQHFPLSTVNSPRKFDFFLPGDGAHEIEPGAELVPYDLIEAFLARKFIDTRLLVAALRELTDAALLLLPAPPPIRDFSALPGSTSDKSVDAEIERYGVAPASLRRKFWLASRSVYIAAADGARVLASAPGVADAEGFRRPEYFARDWIHANQAWGGLVLGQIGDAWDALGGER